MPSIYEGSTDYESDDGSISINNLEEIWYGSYVHPDNNSRDTRLKTRDHIKKVQGELKGA